MTMNETPLTIAGNITATPELSWNEDGRPWMFFSVAANDRYRNGRNEWVDGPTSYYDVLVNGVMGENLAESIVKGDRVIVTGRWHQRTYETEAGEKRSTWRLVATEIGVSVAYATARPLKRRTSDQTEPNRSGQPNQPSEQTRPREVVSTNGAHR